MTALYVRPALFAAFLAVGCATSPESNPPPDQADAPAPAVPATILDLLVIGEASPYVVRDVGAPAAQGRWVGQRPSFRFRLDRAAETVLIADLIVPGESLAGGPLAITFFVNGHTLDRAVYAAPGPQHYEHAIPPQWLFTDADTLVALNAERSFILSRIGLRGR